MNQIRGQLINPVVDEDYKKEQPFPQMVGRDKQLQACHENHIFLFPINPTEEIYQNYKKHCEEWNNLHFDKEGNQIDGKIKSGKMKACYLALVFRDVNGNEQIVRVLQTSRYIYSDDTDAVIASIHEDRDFFLERGFDVCREKIEARAYGIEGIPLTDEQMLKFKKYFEFHIKVGRKNRDKNQTEISEQEIQDLQKISRIMSEQFQVPVPLSYNYNKNKFNEDGEGHQRFLNIRFRTKGRNSCEKIVKELESAIYKLTNFESIKAIQEYVWYDTFTQLDKGWIDYTEEELQKMYPGNQEYQLK